MIDKKDVFVKEKDIGELILQNLFQMKRRNFLIVVHLHLTEWHLCKE